jgi:hypothetical protein
MTQDEIIEMARQAGLDDDIFPLGEWDDPELMTFAKLVAAKKQEDIIKVIESLGTWAHIEEVVNTIRGLK